MLLGTKVELNSPMLPNVVKDSSLVIQKDYVQKMSITENIHCQLCHYLLSTSSPLPPDPEPSRPLLKDHVFFFSLTLTALCILSDIQFASDLDFLFHLNLSAAFDTINDFVLLSHLQSFISVTGSTLS